MEEALCDKKSYKNFEGKRRKLNDFEERRINNNRRKKKGIFSFERKLSMRRCYRNGNFERRGLLKLKKTITETVGV
jgi:hypothetical protein